MSLRDARPGTNYTEGVDRRFTGWQDDLHKARRRSRSCLDTQMRGAPAELAEKAAEQKAAEQQQRTQQQNIIPLIKATDGKKVGK